MINRHLRKTLEKFLVKHGRNTACDDELCIVRDAEAWVNGLRNQLTLDEDAEHEMLLMALAFLLYQDQNRRAEKDIERYQAAIAASVARNGGVLRVDLEEIKALDGTMHSFVADDGGSITYRFVDQSVLRS